jgi:putative amino-acid transport system permease protein
MRVLDFDYMLGLIPILLRYLPLTLQMATAGMVFALILSCGLAVIRVLKIPGLNAATMLFISFFRGTPLLVQLFLFYYGLLQLLAFLTQINGITATIMGLTLHFSAYIWRSRYVPPSSGSTVARPRRPCRSA